MQCDNTQKPAHEADQLYTIVRRDRRKLQNVCRDCRDELVASGRWLQPWGDISPASQTPGFYLDNSNLGRRLVIVSRLPRCFGQEADQVDEWSVSDEQATQLQRIGAHVRHTSLNGPAWFQLEQMNILPERDYIVFFRMDYRGQDGEYLTGRGYVFEQVENLDELLQRVFSLLSQPTR